jgi:predicted permease
MRLRVLLWRVLALFTARRHEADLNDDIAAHLDLLAAEYIRNGMSADDARAKARREFGGVDQMKEAYRDQRGLPLFAVLWQDLRYAARTLRRSPGFTFVAAVSLGIGIGFNTAVFAIVDAVLFSPVSTVHRSDQLADVFTTGRDGETYQTSSYPDYLDFRASSTAFRDIIAYSPSSAAVSTGGPSRFMIGEVVSGNYFQVLGVNAAAGRTLIPEDDRPGAPRAALISYRFWQREFGTRSDAVGTTIQIAGHPYTIVGVTPKEFVGSMSLLKPQIWTAMAWKSEIDDMGISEYVPSPGEGPSQLERRGWRWLFLKGRLQDGETIERARDELQAVNEQLAAQFPATNKNRRISVVRTDSVRLHPQADLAIQATSALLLAVFGLVLLVACANVTGMLLARVSGRQTEIAVRLAIGASRRRLLLQLLTESTMVALTAAAASLVPGWLLLRLGAAGAPVELPIPITLEANNIHVLGFAASISLLAGMVAGLAPALKATRLDVMPQLKGDAPARVGRLRWSLRDALVALQMAIALVFLISAALLTRSAMAAGQVDVGFHPEGVAAVSTPVGHIGYDATRATAFYNRALERVRALPGVEAAGLSWRLPLDLTNFYQEPVLIPGVHDADDKGVPVDRTMVSPDYFKVLSVPILEGRNFDAADTQNAPRVAIVNQAMAQKFWPNVSAIGKRFRLRSQDGPEYEVVGVSANYKVRTVGETSRPYFHVAAAQWGGVSWTIVAKTRGDAAALIGAIQNDLLTLEPNLVFPGNRTLESVVATALLPVRFAASSLNAAGLIAMSLAAVGLYGMIAYAVSRRTRELAVRIALGATRREILTLVMRRGLFLAAIGALVGMALAVAAARGLSILLYKVESYDPLSWSAAIVVLFAVGLLANLVPARRASRIEPMTALRRE